MTPWPLTAVFARLLWLRALCGVAEGAAAANNTDAPAPGVVAAVLGDPLKRLCIFGGRDGMPRSLASVFGCLVARFLGGLCGTESRDMSMPGLTSACNGMAISRDGMTLLLSGHFLGTFRNGVHAFSAASGTHLQSIGGWGDGPLQFKYPCQLCVSPDDFVFVADVYNSRIQVLTPHLKFHGFVGKGQLVRPTGVCANHDDIAVSDEEAHCICVFRRSDGDLLRRFACYGLDHGQLRRPAGLCFVPGSQHIAVADSNNHRISMFTLHGDFVRSLGVGELYYPSGAACSFSGDEVVIVDSGHARVVVLSANGEVLKTMGRAKLGIENFAGVAIHGGSVFAQVYGNKCVVYT